MSRFDLFFHKIFCSKITIFRIILILGTFLAAYLFIYKIDINATATLARNLLIPRVSLNQKNVSIFPVPIIPRTNATIISAAPTEKISKTVPATIMNNALTSELNNTENKSISDQPKEAFVTFCNSQPSYMALLNVLLDSVHAFSTRPIIAFGIDVDLDIDIKKYPRAIKRRIKQSDCGPSVFFCKIHAIVSSNLDYGVLMEPDDVVNYNVDVLFDVLHVWPYPVPLSPRHPDDPQNYHHFMRRHNVSKRTLPYIHAHVIWNYLAMPFLRNLQSLLRQGDFQGANFDETAVNVMLWKAGANHTLCKYDPYFIYSTPYENWPTIENCSKYCYTAFVTLHGCKEHLVSAALLTRLKANVGKPTIQLPGMGGMTYMNNTNATCCYPDSKRSPIHPLLCEHPPPE